MKPTPAAPASTPRTEQQVLPDVVDGERGQMQERCVTERRPADHARGDGGQDDHPERLGIEIAEDEFHREEHPREGGVERRRDAARGPAGNEQAHPFLADPHDPAEVDPSAEPIWMIGPSRPTDPPPPMHNAEANALTAATCGAIRPPRRETANITSGTPCPGLPGRRNAPAARRPDRPRPERAPRTSGQARNVRVGDMTQPGIVGVPGQQQGEALD